MNQSTKEYLIAAHNPKKKKKKSILIEVPDEFYNPHLVSYPVVNLNDHLKHIQSTKNR